MGKDCGKGEGKVASARMNHGTAGCRQGALYPDESGLIRLAVFIAPEAYKN